MQKAFHGDFSVLKSPQKRDNGFLRFDAFFTRIGVFDYFRADGSKIRELRLAEEVFDQKSVDSFKMITATMGHPRVPVTSLNASKYSVGISGEDVRRDGVAMRGSLLITDEKAIKKMIDDDVNEISNGYFCDLEPTSGVTKDLEGIEDGLKFDCIQRNIRGNHVAIVDAGRAGPSVKARVDALRFDSADDVIFSVCEYHSDKKEDQNANGLQLIDDDKDAEKHVLANKDKSGKDQSKGNAISDAAFDSTKKTDRKKAVEGDKMEDFKVTLGGVVYSLKGDATAQQAINLSLKQSVENADKMTADSEHTEAMLAAAKLELEAMAKEKEALEGALDAAKDPENIKAMVDSRVALETSAAKILGDKMDRSSSDEKLMIDCITATQKTAKLDGKSAEYLQARFDACLDLLADKAGSKKNGSVRAAAISSDASEKSILKDSIDARNKKLAELGSKPL